uniref:Uncharacterized protein n=1 Tax=Solanum lycopersicum TaxID=4081 RepID=A0A3Q7G7T1_SOLLC
MRLSRMCLARRQNVHDFVAESEEGAVTGCTFLNILVNQSPEEEEEEDDDFFD